LDYSLFKGQGLDHVKVNSLPASIIEDGPYAINEGYLSDFLQVCDLDDVYASHGWRRIDVDVDIDVVFEGEPFDGAHPRMIVVMDPALWGPFMLKKDLNPETLRWFLFFNSLTLRFLTNDNRCMV